VVLEILANVGIVDYSVDSVLFNSLAQPIPDSSRV
jgi:hypothetical protein